MRNLRPTTGLFVLSQQLSERMRAIENNLSDGQAGQFPLSRAGQDERFVRQLALPAEHVQLGHASEVIRQHIPAPLVGGIEHLEGQLSLVPRASAPALVLGLPHGRTPRFSQRAKPCRLE